MKEEARSQGKSTVPEFKSKQSAWFPQLHLLALFCPARLALLPWDKTCKGVERDKYSSQSIPLLCLHICCCL